MVINDSAIYKGSLWNANELKDSKGHYIEDYRLKMRMESQKNQFTCPECGEPVILCAGLIMEPFFRHYGESSCTLNEIRQSKHKMIARSVLYHLLKNSFGEKRISSNVKITKDIMVDFVVNLDQSLPIAVRYLSHEPKLEDCERVHQTIISNRYVDLCFLKYSRRYSTDKLTTFEYLLTTFFPGIYYVVPNSRGIVIKYAERLSNKQDIVMKKNYSINDLIVHEDGRIVCDLADEIYEELVRQEEELEVRREKRQQVRSSTQEMRNRLQSLQEEELRKHRENESRRLGI